MEFVALTHPGLIRDTNEDAVAVHPDLGLVVVADGMGGHRGGAVASRMAVEGLVSQIHQNLSAGGDLQCLEGRLAKALENTNRLIYERSRQDPALAGMGTTLVAGAFRDQVLIYTWVGDSRVYRFRQGRLEMLSRDHSLVQEMLDEGVIRSEAEALSVGIGSNVLTRALGSEPAVEPGEARTDVARGDIFLFCTDGLTHLVGDEEIQAIVADADHDLQARAERLIESACLCGGTDNITLVLVGIG